MFRDLQVILLFCEEKGYQEEKRLESCFHIPQLSESTLEHVSYYKLEPKCANYIRACALSAKSPKGLRALKWDLGAWTQNGSPQNPCIAVPKAQQHLRFFFRRALREGTLGRTSPSKGLWLSLCSRGHPCWTLHETQQLPPPTCSCWCRMLSGEHGRAGSTVGGATLIPLLLGACPDLVHPWEGRLGRREGAQLCTSMCRGVRWL